MLRGFTIDGQKAKTTVSGNDSVPVFEVGPGAKFDLNHLTVAHGRGSPNQINRGGGLLNSGEVTVRNSTFSDNNVTSDSAAILNGGTLEVTNSTFSGNSATSNGGGIATLARLH